jgi:hypothetical protein
MSSIKLESNASGTGIFTIASPNSNTNRTLTLPDNTGTIITTGSTFAGTGPAFSAYASANQSLSNSTLTKIQFNTEEFDTANCYDNATNYRFTPNVAGYYQITMASAIGSTATGVANTQLVCAIYKNGSSFKFGGSTLLNNTYDMIAAVSALIYLNGSTDYVEGYFRQISGGSINTAAGQAVCYFQGALVRSA